MTCQTDIPPDRLTDAEKAEALADNEAMVWWVARKLRRKSPLVDLDDLASEVRLGFVVAADRFEPSRGLTFGTYASQWGWRYGANFCQREHPGGGLRAPSNCWPKRLCNTSLSAPTGDGGTLHDFLPDDRHGPEGCKDEWLGNALRQLPPRWREIVELYYFGRDGADPMTYDAIGRRMSISKERVRQLLNRSLERIRQLLPDLVDLLDEGRA